MIKLKALLVLNGNIGSLKNWRVWEGNLTLYYVQMVVPTHCLKASLMPSLVIGDLDSISKET